MPAELAIHHDQETVARPNLGIIESERREPQTELDRWVNHLDRNWQQEGLPRDWYNFGDAGFSMRSQMELLPDLNPTTRSLWAERTEQDIRGFTVEYLKQDLVHPSFYRKEYRNGELRLIDEKYGKEIEEMVLEAERGGSVRAALREVKGHLSAGGKAAIISSPKGETGLTTDQGQPIIYPDAWMFGLIDLGDKVVNFGVKTDFSMEESREAVRKMTGKVLSPDAKPEEYVRSVAKIESGQGINTPNDLVTVMEHLRPGPAYGDRGWGEVRAKVGRLNELYGLELKAEGYIQEFRNFVAQEGHTKLELQKALTATLLRLSKLYLFEEKQTRRGNHYSTDKNVIYPQRFQDGYILTIGEVLKEVEQIPGCAGGGKSTSVTSIVERFGVGIGPSLPEDKFGKREFECPSCHNTVVRPQDELISECPKCGSKEVAC